MKILFLLSVLSLSLHAVSNSVIRVINDSNFPVVAIWQAGGCIDMAVDPEDDSQYTVCKASGVAPGDEVEYNFNFLLSDRSVKLWRGKGEKIAYCNSMDDETLRVTGTNSDNLKVTGC